MATHTEQEGPGWREAFERQRLSLAKVDAVEKNVVPLQIKTDLDEQERQMIRLLRISDSLRDGLEYLQGSHDRLRLKFEQWQEVLESGGAQ